MQRLLDGLHHFQSSIFTSRHKLFERLAHDQALDALFITCSDSRINLNLITQTVPGELFMPRIERGEVLAFDPALGKFAHLDEAPVVSPLPATRALTVSI